MTVGYKVTILPIVSKQILVLDNLGSWTYPAVDLLTTGSVILGGSVVPAGSTLSVPTAGLGNVSLQAANTTQVAQSCRPIVIATMTTALTLVGNVATDLVYSNVIRDNSAAYNTTTGVFTAPYTGIYAVTATSFSTFVNGSLFMSFNNVTATELTRIASVYTNNGRPAEISGRQLVILNAGDTRKMCVITPFALTLTQEPLSTTRTVAFMSIEYLGQDF